jgi:hypothetical protein
LAFTIAVDFTSVVSDDSAARLAGTDNLVMDVAQALTHGAHRNPIAIQLGRTIDMRGAIHLSIAIPYAGTRATDGFYSSLVPHTLCEDFGSAHQGEQSQ